MIQNLVTNTTNSSRKTAAASLIRINASAISSSTNRPANYTIDVQFLDTKSAAVVTINPTTLERYWSALGLTSEQYFKLVQGQTAAINLQGDVVISYDQAGKNLMVSSITRKIANQPEDPNKGVARTTVADWPEKDPISPFTSLKVPGELYYKSPQVRFGYAIIDAPISYIQHSRQSRITQLPIMRSTGTIKKGAGQAYENYTVSFTAHGPAEIANSVKAILEQITLTPFMTVEGGPFGVNGGELADIPHRSIAIRNFSISTVAGFPNSLQVDLNFDPFMSQFYLPPQTDEKGSFRHEMDDFVCWPLFKVWAKTRSKSTFNGTEPFNGNFKLYYPNPGLAKELDLILDSPDVTTNSTDHNALITLRNKLTGGGEVISKHLKEVILPQGKQEGKSWYIFKADTKEVFNAWKDSEFYVGLVEWENLANANHVDFYGNLLPSSTDVSPDWLTRVTSSFNHRDVNGTLESSLVTIWKQDYEHVLSMEDQIQNWVYDTLNGGNPPATGDANYNEITSKIQTYQERPWEIFALCLKREQAKGEALLTKTKDLIASANGSQYYKYEINSIKIYDLLKGTDLKSLVLDGSPDNDIIIESIGGSRGHNLAMLSQRGKTLPIHQYMGGMDATFVVQGKCFSAEAKDTIEKMKIAFDERCLNRTSKKYLTDPTQGNVGDAVLPSLMYIDNEIFHLLGVDFVMPVTVTMQSIDGQPNAWDFTLTFIEYNPRQKKAEEVKFIPTTWQNIGRVFEYGNNWTNHNPIIDRATEYFNLQASLKEETLFPDMQLPTKNELRFWINSIYKGAKAFKLNHGIFRNSPSKSINKDLSAEEFGICQLVSDYIEEYADTIIDNFVLQGETFTDISAFADPDFYIYQDASQSFNTIFDDIAQHLMGGKDHKLHAKGRTAEEDDIPGPYREYDPNYGTSSTFSHGFWAANPEAVDYTAETATTAENFTFPKATYQKAKKIAQDAADKLDQTPGAWWTALLTSQGNQTLIGHDQTSVGINPNQSGTWGSAWETDSKSQIPIKVDPTAGPNPHTVGNLSDYYTYAWRQAMAKQAVGMIPNLQTSKDTFLNKPMAMPVFMFTEESIERFSSQEFTIADLEAEVRKEITDDNLGKASFDLSSASYLRRVANLNADFYNNTKLDDSVPSKLGTGIQGMRDSWDFVNALGRAFGVDPHLIRAVFLYRSNFGAVNPQGTADNGFGDYKVERVTKDGIQALGIWCFTYRKYILQYKVPSLALLATDIELSTAGESRWNNIDNKLADRVIEDFNNTVKKFQDNLSEDTSKAINLHLQKYGDLGIVINEYNATYISLCRVYGSYYDTSLFSYDSFFFPFSRLIVLDVIQKEGALDDKNNNTATVNTTHSPTGENVSISTSRTEVSTENPYLKQTNFDKKNLSPIVLAKLGRKMRAGLDPQSEGSIYGMLVDMRTHSSFGRLRGAFPAFQVLLINEGYYWLSGNKKLWDQFYTRTGIASIEVHRSRHMPATTATVTFSNMFHYITAYSLTEAMAHNIAVRNSKRMGKLVTSPLETPGKLWSTLGEMWNAFVVKGVPEDVKLIWQNNHLKRLALNVGTRIQIRMGYGSDASSLPVVFNGSVMNAPVDEDMVTLTCVSDGYELEKPTTTRLQKANSAYAFVDGGAFGVGADPSSIVTATLVAATNWDNITQGNFRDFSGGIAHFGDTYFDGLRRFPAEVQINLYSPKLTRIEQGIEEIQRFNIINGITNWGNEKNLFTVSVQEPTPWKVMEVCRRACLDFVAAAEPFANRSTVFFGKWWWPYNFGYSPDILNINPAEFQGAGFETLTANEDLHLDEKTQQAILQDPSNLNNYGQLVWVGPTHTSPGTEFVLIFDKNIAIIYKIHDDYNVKYDVGSAALWSLFPGTAAIMGAIKAIPGAPGPNINPVFTSTWLNDPNKVLEKVTVLSMKELHEREVEFRTIVADPVKTPDGIVHFFPDDVSKIDKALGDASKQKYADIIKAAYKIDDPKSRSKYETAIAGAKSNMFKTSTMERVPLDFMNDTSTLVSYLLWKPYMQAHIAHSGINLLDNKIEADSSKVYTDAIGTHQYNGWLSPQSINRTIVFSVDTDIHPADRKTMMVDTGLLLTGMQGGGDAIAQDLLSLPGRVPLVGGLWNSLTGGFQSYIEENPTTPAIENGVISALCDQVKEMYQGWFTIIGSPTIKPRDLILLTDHITDLRGPVFVKDVIHRMDAESGFITLISPDAVVLHHASTVALQTIKSLTAGVLARTGAAWVLKAGIFAFAAALTSKATKGVKLAETMNLQRYKWLQSKDGMKNRSKTVLTALQAPIKDTKEKKLKEMAKKLADLNKDTTANADAIKALETEIRTLTNFSPQTTQEALDWLSTQGVNTGTWFNTEGAEKFKNLAIRQAIFEEELVIERTKYLDDIAKGYLGQHMNKTEALEAVDKMLDNRRAAFILNNLDDFMKAPAAEEIFASIKELQELIDIRQAGNATLDAAAIAKNAAKEAQLIETLTKNGDIIPLFKNDLNLSTEIRRALHLTADVGDNALEVLVRSFGKDLVGTPGTIIKGTGEGVVQIFRELSKNTRALKDAIKKRELMALFPSLKTSFYYKQAQRALEINNLVKAGKETAEGAKIAQAAIKAESIQHFLKSWEEAKRICNILSYMGPQALLKAAWDISIMIIFNSFIEGINARFRARQCVKIIPLMSGDVPYVAGIKGHQGAVIGDSPSWGDELISGVHPSIPSWMNQAYITGVSLLGVTLPEYGSMDQDQQYLDDIKADRAQSLQTYKEANRLQGY